ncbi:gastrula zinc finger protein XlCGF8.2DB-like isoform X2, partial [Gryllus bimaculatus]
MRVCQACRVAYTDKEIRVLNLKMHVFPQRDWQRNFLLSWLSFCGMPLQTVDLKNKFVCSMHFSAEDYFPGGNRRLRLDAVPHLCPPSELVVDGDPNKIIATKPTRKKNLYDLGRREMVENVKRQLCRLCGKRESQLRPIFENSSEEEKEEINSSIATKIKMYLPVKIDKAESLPLNICSVCSNLLDKFHEISITCVAVDNILRRSFGVDQTDALFEDPKERADREAMESEKYKQHLRRTVSWVVQEHNTLVGAITKPMEPAQQYLSNCKEVEGSGSESGLKHKQFICSYCGESFRFFKLRTKHIVVCRELPGVCEVCGKEFPRKDLKKHMKQAHTLPKNYMCDKCAKCFRSMQTLDYHSKTRHEPKPDIKHFCELCCKTFSTKTGYETHLKNHENGNINLIFSIDTDGLDDDSVVFKCSVCEETFDNKLSLIVHLNIPKEVKCGRFSLYRHTRRYHKTDKQSEPQTLEIEGFQGDVVVESNLDQDCEAVDIITYDFDSLCENIM